MDEGGGCVLLVIAGGLIYLAVMAVIYVLMGIYFGLSWLGANVLAFLDKTLSWWGTLPPTLQWALSGFLVAAALQFAATEAPRLNRLHVRPMLILGTVVALMMSGFIHFEQGRPVGYSSTAQNTSAGYNPPTGSTKGTSSRLTASSTPRPPPSPVTKGGASGRVPLERQLAGATPTASSPEVSKMVPPSAGFKPKELASYVAHLSYEDHCNSNGAFLPEVPEIRAADILLQDRFNYHKKRHRDTQDNVDPLWEAHGSTWLRDHFETKPLRFGEYFKEADILNRSPIVKVTVFEDSILVERINGGEPLSGQQPAGSTKTSTTPTRSTPSARPGKGSRLLKAYELRNLTAPPANDTWFTGSIQVFSRSGSKTVLAHPIRRVGDRTIPQEDVILGIEFTEGINAPSGWPERGGRRALVELPSDHPCKIEQWKSVPSGGARIECKCYGRLNGD